MELSEIMRHRRSVRKYTDEPVPEDALEKILQAALLTPTSMNKRPWEYYVIKDRQILKERSRAKQHGAALLEGCDTAVAVFADSDLSDVWVEDCSIALAYMDLMASSLGVGSCWVQMRNRRDQSGSDAEENVRNALGVDLPYRIVGILALGMPAEDKAPYDLQSLMWDKVHR